MNHFGDDNEYWGEIVPKTEKTRDKFVITAVYKSGGNTSLNEKMTREELPEALDRIFAGEENNIRSITITQVEKIRV